jgi:predicted deacylase
VKKLIEGISWRRIPVDAGKSVGHVELTIGCVGEGTPTGLVVAGVHGDEGPWGAWAINKLLEETPIDELKGSLRVVSAANPLAMKADARNAPVDGLDLNRAFPGDAEGSHTERLAYALAVNAVDGADVVVDLHGGGSWCVNSFVFQFPGCGELSRCFDAPFLVTAAERETTITGYALSRGASAVGVEMGGRSEDEEMWAHRIAEGVRRALGVAGVLTPSQILTEEPVEVASMTVLKPSRDGILRPVLRTKDIGTVVEEGAVLGELLDAATGEAVEEFTAPFPETAVLLLRPTLTWIDEGTMAYIVASVEQNEKG